MEIEKLKEKAFNRKKQHQTLLKQLKKKRKQEVDAYFHEFHHEIFERIDCLECANCCKTTGPLFTNKDIERISDKLKMKEVDFISTYLRKDEDGDMVLQKTPCEFLGDDNYCSIYEFRPKACREYPHTNRVDQPQIFNLTLKNAEICPAVFDLLEMAIHRIK